MAPPIKNLPITASQSQVLKTMQEGEGHLALRARIILGLGEGHGQAQVAKNVKVTIQTVSKWSRRFVERGVEGLADDPRSGRPRLGDDVVRTVCSARLGEIKWVAHEAGVSRSPAGRWRREHPELVPEPQKRNLKPPDPTNYDDLVRYHIHGRHTVWHVRRVKPRIDSDEES